MGQAKLRKEEILKLKSQMFPKLIGFGAYYKDLDDDGVVIAWNSLAHPQHKSEIELFYSATKKCFEQELNEFNTGNYDYFHNATTADEAKENILGYLQHQIKQYNILAFGSETRPSKGTISKEIPKKDGAHYVELCISIVCNIWLLQELKVIECDNYNGMMFNYASR
jgi:hypothetical protein